MDIITKSLLYYIQSKEGTKNAVLAGGAVRDTFFDLLPKDYDIFVPAVSKKQVTLLVEEILKEFGITDSEDKTIDYKNATMANLSLVHNFTYEDKMYDIIGVKEADDGDFPDKVIRTFDYGLNMCYNTGAYVQDQNENFKYDMDHDYMSLINLRSIKELPKAMGRFTKFTDKLREHKGHNHFRFAAPCLQMKNKRDVNDVIDNYKKTYTLGLQWDAPPPPPNPNHWPQAIDDPIEQNMPAAQLNEQV